ncbi:MAG: GGDEF domain-containing protein [Candidatus Saccharicenans sp.]|uniref:GGDEF domain-containing protein n=1 Tax=Candidatus Saccharicenans sp. TaxID=2819258 RepID=UPI004049904D
MSNSNQHLITLTFSNPELERRFQEHYHQRVVFRFRYALVLAIILYSIFALLDSVSVGELWPRIWFIRFAIVNPLLLLALLLSFKKNFFINYYQEIASFGILVGGGGILAMLAKIPDPALYLYSQGLMLVLIYNYTFLGLRFIRASLNYLLIIIGFEIISLRINPLPSHVLINNNFFLLSANLIGMAVAYYLEKLHRDNFLHGISLRKLAETDSLTGLLSRGFFMDEVKRFLSQSSGEERRSAFCLLDLDRFKEINDNLGHMVGDDILMNLGQTIRCRMRASDLIGRLGGDELGFFFPEIKDEQDIFNIFGKLKTEFQILTRGLERPVTFSVGCVIFGPEVRDLFQCYALADRALLKAKQSKNRLIIVDGREAVLLVKEL